MLGEAREGGRPMKVLKWVLLSIGAVIAAVCVYLVSVAILPDFEVPEQPLKKTGQGLLVPHKIPSVSKKEVSFTVNATEIRAWLYVPQGVSGRLPCIVMASGLGGTKEMGESYAVRFQGAGFVVLAFDYRCFGESKGEPRQLIWVPYQLEDWMAAVEYVRGLAAVDPSRIALWGTSFSGGHVIVTAARDHKIACIVAQCPGVDGRASAELAFDREPIGYSLRMLMHGQRDLVRSWLGLSPHKVPIVGKPGSIALMTASHAYEACP
jgi:dienelactone hydrolase